MILPFLFLFLAAYFLSGKDLLHPGTLLSGIWFLGLLSLSAMPSLYPVGFYGGCIAFAFVFTASLGSFTFNLCNNKSNKQNISLLKGSCNHSALSMLTFITIFGCIVFLTPYLVHIREYNSLAEYFFRARVADLAGEPFVVTGWFLSQFPALALVTSLFILVEQLRNNSYQPNKLIITIQFILTAISLSISGTRSILIIYVLLLVFIYLGMRKISFKRLMWVGGTFILLYSVSAYFMRASEADKESLSLVEILVKHLLIYVFGGIKGFDMFLTDQFMVYHQLFANFIGQLPESMDFAKIGTDIETNVYSAFAVYTYYLGYWGALLLVFVLFTISSYFYKLKHKNVAYFILSRFAIMATALTVFHDYFLVLFPYIGRVLILYLLLYNTKPLYTSIRKSFA